MSQRVWGPTKNTDTLCGSHPYKFPGCCEWIAEGNGSSFELWNRLHRCRFPVHSARALSVRPPQPRPLQLQHVVYGDWYA